MGVPVPFTVRAYDVNVIPERPLSALPSPRARLVGFISILAGGLAGGLLRFALVDIQADGDSSVLRGLGIFSGSVIAAGGTAIIAVLVLRALGEWKALGDQ